MKYLKLISQMNGPPKNYENILKTIKATKADTSETRYDVIEADLLNSFLW
jgi:hypothetical protein